MNWTTIDPEQMYSSANHTAACLGELETHLKGLVGVQGDLQGAVSGATGTAIFNALSDSHQKGRELATFLENIVYNMQQSGVKLDGADLDAAGLVDFNTQFDSDGTFVAGAMNSEMPKVDTSTWA